MENENKIYVVVRVIEITYIMSTTFNSKLYRNLYFVSIFLSISVLMSAIFLCLVSLTIYLLINSSVGCSTFCAPIVF